MLIASSFLSALQHSQFFHLAAGLTSGVGVLYKNIARDCAKDPGYRLSPIRDCPLFYQHSADAFVKRNLPAKSLALQLEVAAVREDGRTDIRAITSAIVTICSRIVTESIHIPSRSLIIATLDIEV